jgi:hypothetical protein
MWPMERFTHVHNPSKKDAEEIYIDFKELLFAAVVVLCLLKVFGWLPL